MLTSKHLNAYRELKNSHLAKVTCSTQMKGGSDYIYAFLPDWPDSSSPSPVESQCYCLFSVLKQQQNCNTFNMVCPDSEVVPVNSELLIFS